LADSAEDRRARRIVPAAFECCTCGSIPLQIDTDTGKGMREHRLREARDEQVSEAEIFDLNTP